MLKDSSFNACFFAFFSSSSVLFLADTVSLNCCGWLHDFFPLSITKPTKAILYGVGKGSEMGWVGVDLFLATLLKA